MLDTYSRTESNVIHVVPVDDLVGHREHGFACVCGPKVRLERCDCGGCGGTRLVVHQALDGRP